MRVLRSIVGAQSLLVQSREANFAKSCSVGSQFVGDDNRRNERQTSKQFPEQPQRRGLIASGLDQDLENLAFAVDGAPHIHLPSSDRDHHFVEMPSIVGLGSDLAQVLGNYWPEFENPPTDRFIADHQAALGQEILDIPVAQGKPKVEPDSAPNDVGRKSVTGVGDGLHDPI